MFALARLAMISSVVAAATVAVPVNFAYAQGSGLPATTAKQAAKAQRKATRKAARAKTNAELGTLEKNGYNPHGKQTNYPQNLQGAQGKVDAAKPESAAK